MPRANQTGELIYNVPIHALGQQINDLQWAPARTYFITACKDKTAKLVSARDLDVMKTYPSDTSLNSACITPKKDYVILGGGQAAMDVTTTAARQGKFEARFYHKIFEDEIGRVRGHFGPLVSPRYFLTRPRPPFAFLPVVPLLTLAGPVTRILSRPIQPARATAAAEGTATSAYISSTRPNSTSCTRWNASAPTG